MQGSAQRLTVEAYGTAGAECWVTNSKPGGTMALACAMGMGGGHEIAAAIEDATLGLHGGALASTSTSKPGGGDRRSDMRDGNGDVMGDGGARDSTMISNPGGDIPVGIATASSLPSIGGGGGRAS